MRARRPRDRRRRHDQHVRARRPCPSAPCAGAARTGAARRPPPATGRANATPSCTSAWVPITRSTAPSAMPSRTRARSLPVTRRAQQRVGRAVASAVSCGTPSGASSRRRLSASVAAFGAATSRNAHARPSALQERRGGAHVLAGQDLGGRHDRGLVARTGSRRGTRAARRGSCPSPRRPAAARSSAGGAPWPRRPRRWRAAGPRWARTAASPRDGRSARRRRRARHPGALGRQAVLAERDAQLQREQLVELQPFDGARASVTSSLGEMDVAQRPVVGQALARARSPRAAASGIGAGSWSAPRGPARGSSGCVMPSDAGWTGRDPPVCTRSPSSVAAQHLDLLVRCSCSASRVARDDAGDRQLLTHRGRRRDPRLVEERQIEVAGVVGDRDGDHATGCGCACGADRPLSRGR